MEMMNSTEISYPLNFTINISGALTGKNSAAFAFSPRAELRTTHNPHTIALLNVTSVVPLVL